MIKVFAILVSMGWILTACNTMEGAGKDIKSAGNSLEDAAKKNKP